MRRSLSYGYSLDDSCPAGSEVLEARLSCRRRIEDIPGIDNDMLSHRRTKLREIQAPELVPLRHDRHGVRAADGVLDVFCESHHAGGVLQAGRGLVVRHRIEGANRGADGKETTAKIKSRRFADIAGVRLEGESQHRDLPPDERPETLVELLHDQFPLALVDLDRTFD